MPVKNTLGGMPGEMRCNMSVLKSIIYQSVKIKKDKDNIQNILDCFDWEEFVKRAVEITDQVEMLKEFALCVNYAFDNLHKFFEEDKYDG